MLSERMQTVGRWAGGAGVAGLLVAAGALWNRPAGPVPTVASLGTPASAQTAAAPGPLVAPVSDVTPEDREARRFTRGDKDKDGSISRDEYLANRRKAFAKLDVDGDGKLSFEESAAKAIAKFTAADADHDGKLLAAEFATTAAKRNPRTKPVCPPTAAPAEDERDS